MAVSAVHRFLKNDPKSYISKRIWIVHGPHLQDWYFHNQLVGCVDLRRTLELWGFDNGMKLTVTLNHDGEPDFKGNASEDDARQMFDGGQPKKKGYGKKFAAGTTNASAASQAATSPTNSQADDATQARAEDAAARTQEAAGGTGTAFLNTFKKLSNIVKSNKLPTLIILDNFGTKLNDLLQADQRNLQHINDIKNIIRNEWHKTIFDTKNLVVFLSQDDQPQLDDILPERQYLYVDRKQTKQPQELEIKASLERLALRKNIQIRDAKAIAKLLASRYETLQGALQRIIHIVNSGERDLTVNKILDMPPINEELLETIKSELNELVGLKELKEKVILLEKKARSIRKQLEEGRPVLEQETLHMVFNGAPGTGKTEAAKLIALLFHSLGLLKKDSVDKLVASTVMSSNVGETRENMQEKLEEARGGVLFIDEAHQFGDKDSMGAKEAVQALVPMSWNYRNEMVIILAGYAEKMHDFYNMDPGIQRRFPDHGRILFRNYSNEELWEILIKKIKKLSYSIDPTAEQRLKVLLTKRSRRRSFGNAGGVDNLFAEIVQNHTGSDNVTSTVISLGDLPPLIKRDEQTRAEAFSELDAMLGVAPVKERIAKIVSRLQYQLEEDELSRGGSISIHPGNMRFVGPSGTGKTTVANLMAKILFGVGCIQKPFCKAVTRGDLVGDVQGASAKAVRALVEEARDGLLFVDEAYSLFQGDNDTFGKESRDELIAQITDKENSDTVFILAGYKADLDRFIESNPGLDRRFPVEIEFPNFAPADCKHLMQKHLADRNHSWEDGFLEKFEELALKTLDGKGQNFGNAGWVENAAQAILDNLMHRVMQSGITGDDPNRRKVMLIDLPSSQIGDGTQQGEVSNGIETISWSPEQASIRLITTFLWDKELTNQVIVDRISACAHQIIVELDDGSQFNASGFFVTPDGLMMTNFHVVDKAKTVSVLCGAERQPMQANVVRLDHACDLAVIAVRGMTLPLAYLPIGISLHVPQLTDLIVYGNAHVRPGEPGRLVTAKVARNDPDNHQFLETDGAIEKGFSGGPAIDRLQGSVVGVVRGGYGTSATAIVRAERLREILAGLGYQFDDGTI